MTFIEADREETGPEAMRVTRHGIFLGGDGDELQLLRPSDSEATADMPTAQTTLF